MIVPAISFGTPWLLLALLLIPLLISAHLEAQKRRARYAVRFPALETLAGVIPATPQWRRHMPVALLCAALAAVVLALAKPERDVEIPVQRATVVLVLDVSGSMGAYDVQPSRLEAAQRAANNFVDQVPDQVRIGLVAYSDSAQTLQTPIDEHDLVRRGLQTLSPQVGTRTGAGLRVALEDLATIRREDPRPPPSAIVLLSDGKSEDNPQPFEQAERARRLNTPIYTVALGTPGGFLQQPDGTQVAVPPDPEALARISQISRGEAFLAEDSGQLDSIYERLGRQLGSTTEKRQITSRFALIGALLLLLAAGTALRWGVRPL